MHKTKKIEVLRYKGNKVKQIIMIIQELNMLQDMICLRKRSSVTKLQKEAQVLQKLPGNSLAEDLAGSEELNGDDS